MTEYSERNINNNLAPASVGKYGIRLRDNIYTKELSADYSKNKVIRKNTLTIGMGSSQIDIGILLDDETYCISPAYTTFKIHNINAAYLQEYLQSINAVLSAKYMITSVRQGKSVNKDELLMHPICICDSDIQQNIATFFAAFRNKLENEKSRLERLNSQKRFLLQQMFI